MLTLLALLVLLAFVCGAELFAVMIVAAALGAITLATGGSTFDEQFYGMVVSMFGVGTGEQATVLSTIPMFIYAGYVLAEAKTADRLVRFANALVGWFPGGLAIVAINTCALFTTFTGASGVTIVALGGVLMPALVKNGYPKKFSMGMIAGTGSVGLLFPPALPLFIYGTIYGLTQVGDAEAAAAWDTQRFIFAGIVPGMVLVAALSIVAIVVAWKLPRQKFELRELGASFVQALPELFIPFGVIAGLASGFALPEVASLTVFYVILLEFGLLKFVLPVMALILAFNMISDGRPMGAVVAVGLLGGLLALVHFARIPRTRWGVLWEVSREAFVMVGAIFVIILCSTVFTNYIVTADVPSKLVAWATQYVDSKLLFLLVLNLLLLIVGMIMDIFSAIVIVLPLIVPISKYYGVDPYHLGVVFLLNLEVGYLTPPVGLNLFITSIKFQVPVMEVMRSTMPFLVTMVVVLGIVTYIPALTIVPEAKRTAPVNNLVLLVQSGIRASKVSVPEVTLVDHAGTVLKGNQGKPVVRKFDDCNFVTDAAGTILKDDKNQARNADETQRDNCQRLFEDVSACMPKGKKAADAGQITCANKATAKWTVDRYNQDYGDKGIIVITEVALADASGAPLTYLEDKKGPDGKPILDELGQPEKDEKPIAGPDGKPFVRTVAWCDQLEFKSDTEKCRQLFVEASNCAISPEPPSEECLEEKCPEPSDPPEAPAGAGSAAGSAGSAAGSAAGSGSAGSAAGSGSAGAPVDPAECKKLAAGECATVTQKACIAEKAKAWAEENPSIARAPKLGSKATATPGGEETKKTGGCSAGDGALAGALIVGGLLVAMRRRRKAA